MAEALYYVTYTGSGVVELKGAGVFASGTGAYVTEEAAKAAQALGGSFTVRAPSAAPAPAPAAKPAPAPAPEKKAEAPPAPKAEEKKPEAPKAEEKKEPVAAEAKG